ncbi:MAG: hypothetical protein D3924_19220 [Candidatus Electrothrix sp. AR4]|nr:hypothetical protein [Candidatus Electrothrix sp. AR4]
MEVTTLLIPGLNDSEEELRQIASFIGSVDPAIPWHLTGFHPTYKMTGRSSTPASSLRMAREIGLDTGLRFVYEGNIRSEGSSENTYCPGCSAELIQRTGFSVRRNRLSKGKCPDCREHIEGVWSFSVV